MSSLPAQKAGHSGVDLQARLSTLLMASMPLDARPFAVIGNELGRSEDEVIECLHDLLAQGVFSHFGPLFDARPLGSNLDQALRAATQSGLPLLPRPFEAVGAMLGVSESWVQSRLASMLADGSILRIGAVLSRPARQVQPPG